MKKRLLLFIMACVGLATLCHADDRMAQEIRETVVMNLDARQSEDMQRMMETIHPESPVYQSVRREMTPLFDNYDLAYELLSFRFIGVSDGYALARTRHRTAKKNGPAFQDNDADMILVFRKENEMWKLWSQAVLEIINVQ